jgi:hypothetical protein
MVLSFDGHRHGYPWWGKRPKLKAPPAIAEPYFVLGGSMPPVLQPFPVDEILLRTAARLQQNYASYWPKSDQSDPTERDLTTALASVLMGEAYGYSVYTEVPKTPRAGKGPDQCIDLLALASDCSSGLLVECKNIHLAKMRKELSGDLAKMSKFRWAPGHAGSAPLPETVTRMILLMGWTDVRHGTDPFQKPEYRKWVVKFQEDNPGLEKNFAKIRKLGDGVRDPRYRYQWIMSFSDKINLQPSGAPRPGVLVAG